MIAVSTNGYMFNPNKNKLEMVASTIRREHIICDRYSIIYCVKKSPNAKVLLIGDSNAIISLLVQKNSPNNEIISLAIGGVYTFGTFYKIRAKSVL